MVPLFVLFPLVEIPAGLYLLGWFLLQFWMGSSQLASAGRGTEGGVAFWAHVGGFVAGVAWALVFRVNGRPRRGTGSHEDARHDGRRLEPLRAGRDRVRDEPPVAPPAARHRRARLPGEREVLARVRALDGGRRDFGAFPRPPRGPRAARGGSSFRSSSRASP